MKLGKKLTLSTGSGNKKGRQRQSSLDYSSGGSRLSSNLGGITPDKQDTPKSAPGRRSPGINFWLQRACLLVLLVAIAASLANLFSLSTSARVVFLNGNSSKSSSVGVSTQPPGNYEATVDAILQNSIWNHNKLTISTGQISQEVLKQYPEIASINISVPLFSHRLLVYLTPAKPALVVSASNGFYVVDSTGKVLSEASTNSASSLHLPLVTASDLRAQINQQILPNTDVTFVQVVVAELAAKQYTVSSFTIPPASSELDAHLTGKGYYIKFNLENNDPKQQAGTFLATIADLQKQNTVPGQYVDVRVDGRAYYQ